LEIGQLKISYCQTIIKIIKSADLINLSIRK